VSPCIADDGTIYCVSFDNHLHAVYPNNGTMKWKTSVGAGTSPTIGHDGTVYCGYSKLYAINPTNGSKKWSYNLGSDRYIRAATPCNSIDGTIYFGTETGDSTHGIIFAVNPDGTEKWRKKISDLWAMSAPAIGEDGTVYIGSCDSGHDNEWGYLYAFGPLDSDAPFAPDINGPTKILPFVNYEYSFKAISPIGNDIYYWIEWGDGQPSKWLGPYKSGEKITLSYTWYTNDKFIIKARAKDTENRWGPWSELTVTTSRDKVTNNVLFWKLLEQFPLLERVLSLI
jgi:outer membrane protein assembly factor BamB